MHSSMGRRANEIVGYIYSGNEGPSNAGKVFDFGLLLTRESGQRRMNWPWRNKLETPINGWYIQTCLTMELHLDFDVYGGCVLFRPKGNKVGSRGHWYVRHGATKVSSLMSVCVYTLKD